MILDAAQVDDQRIDAARREFEPWHVRVTKLDSLDQLFLQHGKTILATNKPKRRRVGPRAFQRGVDAVARGALCLRDRPSVFDQVRIRLRVRGGGERRRKPYKRARASKLLGSHSLNGHA